MGERPVGDGDGESRTGDRGAGREPADPEQVAVDFAAGMYRAVLDADGFVDLLDLWDERINNTTELPDDLLGFMNSHVTAATPLLEDAIRNMPTSDDLVRAVSEETHPCILIARSGLVIAANDAASAYFGLTAGGVFEFARVVEDDGRLLEMFFERMSEVGSQDGALIVRLRENGQPDRLVAVTPFRLRGSQVGFARICGLDLAVPERAYELMASAFGLTPIEREVMRQLMDGKSGTELARERGIREDTVKKQIRNIREKTGASGRAELMRMVASLARIAGSTETASRKLSVTNFAGRTYTPPSTHHVIEIDGKRVEYITHGPAGAVPVVIMHGAISGFILSETLISAMISRGMRIILPMRPGFGLSQMLAPGATQHHVGLHVAAFADALGLDRFALLTSGSGCFSAMALQQAFPQRVITNIATAVYLPTDRQRLAASMPPWVRGFVSSVGRYPQVARFIITGGYRYLLQKGPAAFMEMLFRRAPSDRALVHNPEVLAAIAVGLPIALAQGIDSFVAEMGLVAASWDWLPRPLDQKLICLHGGQDSIFPVQLVREYARNCDHCRLIEVPDAGQLLFYSHPEMVVSVLARELGLPERQP